MLNLKRASELVYEAASRGAKVIILPEMFVCPYTKEFMLNAKEFCSPQVHGKAYDML